MLLLQKKENDNHKPAGKANVVSSVTKWQGKEPLRWRTVDAMCRLMSAAKSGATYEGTRFTPEPEPSICDSNVASISSRWNLKSNKLIL